MIIVFGCNKSRNKKFTRPKDYNNNVRFANFAIASINKTFDIDTIFHNLINKLKEFLDGYSSNINDTK